MYSLIIILISYSGWNTGGIHNSVTEVTGFGSFKTCEDAKSKLDLKTRSRGNNSLNAYCVKK